MNFVVSLSHNLALLFSLTFLYGLIETRLSPHSKRSRPFVVGILFGLFSVISTTLPVPIVDGVMFTGRTLLIGIAGLFGGAIPAVIAALMVTFSQVVAGSVTPIVAGGSALLAALLSVGLRRWVQGKLTSLVLVELGLILAANALLWSIIGLGIGLDAALHALLVIIWLYSLTAWILGSLLLWQQARLATEHALHISEQRFRAIFNSTFQFAGLLEPDGTILEMNQTALDFIGATQEQVVGCLFWETPWWQTEPETQQRLHQAVEQAASGKFVRYEVEVHGVDDHLITIDFSLKPIYATSGTVLMLIPEGRDISERKALEIHRLEVEREQARLDVLRTFIPYVSHDFRTPLAILNTNIYLLSRIADPAQQAKRLDIMQQQIERLTRLLDDMSIVTRLELNMALKDVSDVELNEIVTDLARTARSAADNKHLTIGLALADDLPPVRGNEQMLNRAVKNLLDNAISYTPEGGTIRLSTQVIDGTMRVEVCDTGIGIAPEDLPNIYDLFYRADKARSMETGGSGIGLYLTRKIVERHGGAIEVESAPDQGSKFRLVFPLGR